MDLVCSLNHLLTTIEIRDILEVGYVAFMAIYIATYFAHRLSKYFASHFGSELRFSNKALLRSALIQYLSFGCVSYKRKDMHFMLDITLLKITNNLRFGS